MSTSSLYITNHMKKIEMKMIFDEMWYIVEYSIINIFYFLFMFDQKNPRRKWYLKQFHTSTEP